jgi:uncharacterized membrane protein SirB2
LYICSKFNDFMKKTPRFPGILLIIIGTLVLLLTRFHSLSSHNWLLLTGLCFIVAGIVVHIRSIKKESKY